MNMNLKIYTKQEEHLRWPHGIDPSPGREELDEGYEERPA
jgi:hypothetical protein